ARAQGDLGGLLRGVGSTDYGDPVRLGGAEVVHGVDDPREGADGLHGRLHGALFALGVLGSGGAEGEQHGDQKQGGEHPLHLSTSFPMAFGPDSRAEPGGEASWALSAIRIAMIYRLRPATASRGTLVSRPLGSNVLLPSRIDSVDL